MSNKNNKIENHNRQFDYASFSIKNADRPDVLIFRLLVIFKMFQRGLSFLFENHMIVLADIGFNPTNKTLVLIFTAIPPLLLSGGNNTNRPNKNNDSTYEMIWNNSLYECNNKLWVPCLIWAGNDNKIKLLIEGHTMLPPTRNLIAKIIKYLSSPNPAKFRPENYQDITYTPADINIKKVNNSQAKTSSIDGLCLINYVHQKLSAKYSNITTIG